MLATLWFTAALAAGADSPVALHEELSTALGAGEPWKIVDYVVPEDQAPIAASFDMMASLTVVNDTQKAELQGIRDRYHVKPVGEAFTSAEFATAVTAAYADVTDYHGLAQDLWSFLKANGGAAIGDPTQPKLKGKGSDHPVLKIGKQSLPIVQRDGRWYIDAPDPGAAKG